MSGFCRKCKMKFDGSNCPICHRKKETNVKTVVISTVIFGMMIIFGILLYTDEIQMDSKNLESIQDIIQEFHKINESTKDIAAETITTLHETLDEQLDNVQLEPIDISVDDIINIPKTIQENNPINKKPIIDKMELEKQIHSLTNQYRIQNGLDALFLDDELSNIARNHSLDMSNRNYFDHVTLEGLEPTDRGNKVGYDCRKNYGTYYTYGLAENIFQNNLYDRIWYTNGIPTSYEWNNLDDLTKSTVDGWMESQGHRENILTGTYDREGIGVVISSDDKVYITQNFC